MNHPIKAAIYCRVATPDQFSLDRQKQVLCDFAKAKGYEISTITTEMYRGTTMMRPGIQGVLADAKSGKMDVLLVYSSTRISRNMIEAMHFFHQLEEFGVTLESVKKDAPLNELLEFIGKSLVE